LFDFRYHALSLVAVFLALGIGIVLGATIGDSLVSSADKTLRSSLHGDVEAARNAAREAQAEASQRERALEVALPYIVQGRLLGERVAVVGTGTLPNDFQGDVKDSVSGGGGTIDSTSEFSVPAQAEDLASAVGEPLTSDTDAQGLTRVGRRIGRLLVRGGKRARQLAKAVGNPIRGDLKGVNSVVFFRSPPSNDASDAENSARQAFEVGLIQGLKRQGVPVAGAETTKTEPSQISWYKDRGLPSVDDLDLAEGHAALVLVLTGEKGSFGVKGTADAPMPELSTGG
jgi:hypothetical protein